MECIAESAASPNPNLDDFFAKRDKTKKKTKKFSPGELVTAKKEEARKKKDKMANGAGGGGTATATASSPAGAAAAVVVAAEEPVVEEEWQEFEEKEVDLSGLKIQNLQLGDRKDDDPDSDREKNLNEDGSRSSNKESISVWNRTPQAVSSVMKEPETVVEEPVPQPEPEPEKTDEKKEEKKEMRYIPPAMRAAAAGGGSSPSSGSSPTGRPIGSSRFSGSRSKKDVPAISSEADFPTLGASRPH